MRAKPGEKYNSYTVLRRYTGNKQGLNWVCQCDCGQVKIVKNCYLVKGEAKCKCQNKSSVSSLCQVCGAPLCSWLLCRPSNKTVTHFEAQGMIIKCCPVSANNGSTPVMVYRVKGCPWFC